MKTSFMTRPLWALACATPLTFAPPAACGQDQTQGPASGSSVQVYGTLDAGAVSEHDCRGGSCPSTKISPAYRPAP
ncbi:hypothetical protein [Pseudoduganella armeniaca]|uniref:hypothetical protein n=1 Tax=Pseudoduganella armeniaca TaxID=2072590 RepID=UPI001E563267|nr:hypothetical protein [Pseudoduganella armeniaca]